jgi:hypothetical protein
MKQSLKSLIIGPLAVALAASIPFAAFAKDNGKGNSSDNGNKNNQSSHQSWVSNAEGSISNWGRGVGNAFGHLIAPGWQKHNGNGTNTVTTNVNTNNNNGAKHSDGDSDKDDNGDSDGGNNGNNNNNNGTSPTPTPNNSNAPVISGITAPTQLSVGQTGTWTVNASDPQNGSLTYSVNWGDNAPQPLFANNASVVQTSTFTHAYGNAGTYTVTFTVTDSAGLSTVSTVTVQVVPSVTASAPVISNLIITNISPLHASVRWTTDQRSNSMVWLSTVSPVNASGTPTITRLSRVFNHSISFANLSPATTYYLIVQSTNSAGLSTQSSQVSFMTTGTTTPVNPSPLTLSGVSASAQQNQAEISWNTNNAANSTVWYSTTTPVNTATAQSVTQGSLVFNHFVLLNGLNASTTYHFVVGSTDGSANTATSSESSFTTSAGLVVNPLSLTNAVAVVGSTGVTLTWNTNIGADSEVYYSTTSPVTIGSASTTASINASLVTNHTVSITGLATSTPYFMIIQSKDASNDTQTTSQFQITTGN